MDQSEIFRLLLVVLLLANKQLSPSPQSERTEQTELTAFDYTAINDVLILTMLLRLFDSPDQNNTNTNTTF